MELRNRLAFHIPEKAWRKNRLEDIDIDAEMGDLLSDLENAGASTLICQGEKRLTNIKNGNRGNLLPFSRLCASATGEISPFFQNFYCILPIYGV